MPSIRSLEFSSVHICPVLTVEPCLLLILPLFFSHLAVLSDDPPRSHFTHLRRTYCETSSMFAAASSFFARSNIFQNYNVGGSTSIVSSRSGTPAQGSSSNLGTLPAPANPPAFFVGPWKVQSGSHKTTNKRVSIWTFDKRSPELEKMGPAGKDRTFEVLKSEVCVSSLREFSGFFRLWRTYVGYIFVKA
jgi:hypothetical protein